MNKHILKVEKRTIVGKKIKKLRREGILPANIYGKNTKSVAVQLPLKDFVETYKKVGETGLLELQLGDETRPALIHTVQLDYVTNQPVHADFYQVNLKEKVKTMVPVVLIGDSPAVEGELGTLLHMVSEVEVEALPTELPEKFEVNVTPLAAVDDQITIADLPKIEGVDVLSEPSQIIVKIAEPEAPEPEPVAEETPVEGEETEAAEGEEKEEGKEPAAEEAPKEE